MRDGDRVELTLGEVTVRLEVDSVSLPRAAIGWDEPGDPGELILGDMAEFIDYRTQSITVRDLFLWWAVTNDRSVDWADRDIHDRVWEVLLQMQEDEYDDSDDHTD